ncbi:MAG: LuxR C-terminal-related transcriptional regulator [Eggerthellaceae bacterium]|nr:LuxR C-terminal-related transcriptional regulator [Eggerthellaceae bacterium]
MEVLVYVEYLVVLLFLAGPDYQSVFLTDFLARHNIFEIVLSLCAVGYSVRSAVRMLRLKRSATAVESDRIRTQEAAMYFAQRYGLTVREREVLIMMIEGMDNQNIASNLQLSIGTIKTHTHHIFEKTDTTNRLELVEKFWSES